MFEELLDNETPFKDAWARAWGAEREVGAALEDLREKGIPLTDAWARAWGVERQVGNSIQDVSEEKKEEKDQEDGSIRYRRELIRRGQRCRNP